MPENKRISGWVTRFILMMLQGTELVCGSQGVLEIRAGCLESSVVHVEGELSFGKCTLFEVSKGVVGCHQRSVHTGVQNDPVFLKLLRNEQKKEPKLSILVGPQGSPKKNQPGLDTLHHTRSEAVLSGAFREAFTNIQGWSRSEGDVCSPSELLSLLLPLGEGKEPPAAC